MKLLCVVPFYWPAFKFGGPTYSVHGLNKTLVKKGVEVTVYVTNVGLGKEVPVNQEVDVDGVKVTYFTFTKFFEYLGATRWQFSWSMTRALKNNIKHFDLIYVVSVWNYPQASAGHYSRRFKKPYIITPRGLLYPYTAGKKSWKKLPYYYLVAKRNLKGASAIHYTTDDEAEKCHSFLGMKNQAIVIPNGIDLQEFANLPNKLDEPDKLNRPEKPNNSITQLLINLITKKIILFLGRVHWIKGIDILIKAYAELLKKRDDVHLLIVGNDEANYGIKVKHWLKEYGLKYDDASLSTSRFSNFSTSQVTNFHSDAKVTFTGMLKGNDKLAVFAASDIFVLPSYSENFGMAVVEAMACGLPVIISNQVGIHKEVARAKAGVIIELDAEQLTKAIKDLIDNPDISKRMGISGQNLVKQYYNIDKVADEVIEAFDEILGLQERY